MIDLNDLINRVVVVVVVDEIKSCAAAAVLAIIIIFNQSINQSIKWNEIKTKQKKIIISNQVRRLIICLTLFTTKESQSERESGRQNAGFVILFQFCLFVCLVGYDYLISIRKTKTKKNSGSSHPERQTITLDGYGCIWQVVTIFFCLSPHWGTVVVVVVEKTSIIYLLITMVFIVDYGHHLLFNHHHH